VNPKSPDHSEPKSAKEPELNPVKDAPATDEPSETISCQTPKTTGTAGEIEKLRDELAQAKDRILRLQAELDNFRKRSSRELHEQLRYANQGLLRDLLPVLDNACRAIEATEKSTDGAALLDGFKLLRQQLEGVLTRHHCQKIEALNQSFDPHSHEAIYQQASADHPPQTVISVTQDGYRLHDRVVRPSQVIVSTTPKET
jgi:molecular chaperone GrpE